MILADKIIELRKKSGMTQDELAEKLDVSRQSVSKWEAAQSTPDLSRVLKMADLFSVSTDMLLRDEFDLSQADKFIPPEKADTNSRRVSMGEAAEFLEKNERSALFSALGIASLIISPVPTVLFDVLSLNELGTVLLFLFLAAGVAMSIYGKSLIKSFRYLKKETYETEYGVDGMVKERKNHIQSKIIFQRILGVVMCILFVVPITLSDAVTKSAASEIGTVIALLMIAAGVFLIVRSRRIEKAYDILIEKKAPRL